MAAAAVVQAFSVTLQAVNGDSITCTEPAGTTSGDLLIAVLSVDQVGDVITANTPSDWTDITGNLAANGVGGRVFWHQRGASAPDLVFNLSVGTEHMVGGVLRIDGHNSTTPIDDFAVGAGSTVTPISPDLNTATNNTLVLRLFMGDRDRITADTGFPSTTDNNHYIRESAVSSAACSQGAADEEQVSAGPVGTAEWTNAFSNSDGWHGVTIAIFSDGDFPSLRRVIIID
jgi:hypothetical protein